MTLLILKLITAHLVIHMLFQKDMWNTGKSAIKHPYKHSLLSGAGFCILASVLIFGGYQVASKPLPLLSIIVGVSIVRYVVDVLCVRCFLNNWFTFIVIQGLHAAFIYLIVSLVIQKQFPLQIILYYLDSPHLYGLMITYTVSLGLGSLIVRLVTQSLNLCRKDSEPGLERAGRYIGVLERFLITTLMLYWPQLDASAIGLIFSAKSIARFPELSKKDGTKFAEYYLVGSLTSLTIAVIAGLVSRHYLLR